jgi:hypothetical protein
MKNVALSGGMMKRNTISRFAFGNKNKIIEVISALFVLLFLYTSLSKLFDYDTFTWALKKSPLIGNVASILAWGIPSLELIISLLLFIPRTRILGLFGSFILMTIFTIYIAYMLVFTPNLPCSCGGVIKHMSWKQHLLFNISFTLVSLIGIILNRKSSEKFN